MGEKDRIFPSFVRSFCCGVGSFVDCCASVSSSCVCFWFLRLNPSYRLLFVVLVTNFAPYYLTLFMHLPSCPRISVFFSLYSVALLDYYRKHLACTILLSEVSEKFCLPQRNSSMLACCPHDGNLAVSLCGCCSAFYVS